MYMILTERVYRVAVSPHGDRFASRHTNQTRWTVSGPFKRQTLAERAAAAALATHTCLSAEVHDTESLTREPLRRYSNTQEFQPVHDQSERARVVIEARRILGIPQTAGAPVEV